MSAFNLLSIIFIISAHLLLIPSPVKSATTKTTTTKTTTKLTTTTKKLTTTTTKKATTATASWIQSQDDGIFVCFGGGAKNLTFNIYSDNMIDSSKQDFFDFFTIFSAVKNVGNAKSCCLKCGASGTFSTCIAFDFDVQTNICQMYSIKTATAHYFHDGADHSYQILEGQPEFLFGYSNNITYVVPQINRFTGVMSDISFNNLGGQF